MKCTRWIAVLIAMGIMGACAKAHPHLTPAQLTHVDLPPAESGTVESEDRMDITIPAFDPLTASGASDQIKARFRGTDRKTPKTTIATGSREHFDTITALAASLPSDDNMLHHSPPIQRDTMTRATEEMRNVQVPAWIYAIKYESDQDWHVIIGTDPSAGAKTFFNAEISGLPTASAESFAKLLAARNALADILDNDLPSGSGYRKFSDPIPVVVEGSLFFDVDHAAGVVGPNGMQPKTAWEIHPITKLSVQ